jgi:pyruvate dehydrogenase E1 component beta subunit
MVGVGVGAAIVGCRPIVEIMFMDFITGAADAIVNHAAKLRSMSGGQIKVPLIIRTQGGTGTQHGAQHSQMLESWFTHIPGLLVAMPTTPQDVRGLYKTAFQLEDPVLFVEHRRLYKTSGPLVEPIEPIPFGHAAVRRPGRDITIVATSFMVVQALQAADRLAAEGVDAEVIDPRTLVPLDVDLIVNSVIKTGRFVVVHESAERAGWGAEVVAQVTARAFDHLDAPPLRLGGKNVPIPFGLNLERLVVPQIEDIATVALSLLRG